MYEQQYTYFIILAPATIIAAVLIAIQVWSQKDSPGAREFAAAMLLVTGWVVFNSFELLAQTRQATLFWAKFTYFFITTSPVVFLLFSIRYFGKEKWLRRSLIPILFVIPLLTNLIVWHPHYTSLIWQQITFKSIGTNYLVMKVLEYGDWFWVSSMYTYILTVLSMLLMVVYTFRASTLYRQQAFWILLGALFPFFFNLIYIFKVFPWLEKDFTPISFVLSGIMVSMGIFRYHLFDLSPMARDVIIDRIDDGFVIADSHNRIIDVNPAAANIFQVSATAILGQPIQKLLAEWDSFSGRDNLDQFDHTIILARDGVEYHYELKITKLHNKSLKDLGTIVLLRDVTERVQLLEEVQQLAMHDMLTGVFNRRHFYYLGARAYMLSTRYHRPVSIVLMDIDHFKRVNDTYGHAAGDRVLQHFSEICSQNTRGSDIFARFGGEEFIMMLPETNETNAIRVAERLREQIAEAVVEFDSQSIAITVSIGISCLKPGEPSIALDALIDRADRALYAAKNNGRNQVFLADKLIE